MRLLYPKHLQLLPKRKQQNKLYCFIYGKEKAPLSGAFSFLGERIEGIREYRFFYRFFVMVEKHFFCVLLYRRDCYVFIPYWLMIMPLFIGSQMFLNELAFCRWVKKELKIQFSSFFMIPFCIHQNGYKSCYRLVISRQLWLRIGRLLRYKCRESSLNDNLSL